MVTAFVFVRLAMVFVCSNVGEAFHLLAALGRPRDDARSSDVRVSGLYTFKLAEKTSQRKMRESVDLLRAQ